jgi:hypothetical protein
MTNTQLATTLLPVTNEVEEARGRPCRIRCDDRQQFPEVDSMRTLQTHLAVSFVAVLLTAAVVVAQQKPDFSGDWILVSPIAVPADIPRAMTVLQIVDRRAMPPLYQVAVKRQISGLVTSALYTVGVQGGTTVIGGSPSVSEPGWLSHYGTAWDGDRLVIRVADGHATHIEVWTIDGSGRLIVAVTDRRADLPEATTLNLVYQRR